MWISQIQPCFYEILLNILCKKGGGGIINLLTSICILNEYCNFKAVKYNEMHGLLFVCVLIRHYCYITRFLIQVKSGCTCARRVIGPNNCTTTAQLWTPSRRNRAKTLRPGCDRVKPEVSMEGGENPNYGCTVYRVIQVQLMFHGNPLARFYPSFVKYLHLSYICHKIQSFYGPRADIVVSG